MVSEEIIEWLPEMMVEVTLSEPDDFLKIRETLTRIGITSKTENILFQSCHILHKHGRYFIVHFKEMFAIDGKNSSITQNDIERRNTIIQLLSDWNLVTVLNTNLVSAKASVKQIKVIPFKEKDQWILRQKYTIGKFKNNSEKL